MLVFCPRLRAVYIYATQTVPDKTLEFFSRLIAPHLSTIYVICEGCDGHSRAGGKNEDCVERRLMDKMWKECMEDKNGVEPVEEREKDAVEKATGEGVKGGEKDDAGKVNRESAKSENASVPDLDVTNNGIEIKMWMKCDETSCVLDLERSGMYDTFNDLSDCETSVRVKCRNRLYFVPTPLKVRNELLHSCVVRVSATVRSE